MQESLGEISATEYAPSNGDSRLSKVVKKKNSIDVFMNEFEGKPSNQEDATHTQRVQQQTEQSAYEDDKGEALKIDKILEKPNKKIVIQSKGKSLSSTLNPSENKINSQTLMIMKAKADPADEASEQSSHHRSRLSPKSTNMEVAPPSEPKKQSQRSKVGP